MDNIPVYQKVCEKAVRAAAVTIQNWIGKTSVRHKGPADLVTEADVAAQETIRKTILDQFPDHELVGEEDASVVPGGQMSVAGGHDAGEQAGKKPASAYRWIADPLDGTTNFVHGVPHYAVSLALEHQGRLLVGAIHDPCLDECFLAAAGQGATLNGRPLHTSTVRELSEAVAATGFPASVWAESPDLLVFLEAVFKCQGVRRTGSAALNLAYLAAGRFDALWAFSTKIWDVAAGVLLVQEAGGVVTSPEGGDFQLETARYIAAATPALHAELLRVVERTLPKSKART